MTFLDAQASLLPTPVRPSLGWSVILLNFHYVDLCIFASLFISSIKDITRASFTTVSIQMCITVRNTKCCNGCERPTLKKNASNKSLE